MSENTANSKRIAKNTLMLYFRMLLLMGVSLYTSRVVLEALGVEDYGIYNVVGGVVAMFTVVSGSLSTTISRFITFELGKKDQKRLNRVFATSVIIQLLLAVIIVILVETFGMWFLNHKMVIPTDRLFAAKWVLQLSLLTLIINLISIPYNASIIAHERMGAFAYIGIFEAICKLAVAYLISIAPIDKLIYYSISMCVVALLVRFTYGFYCRAHFEECKIKHHFDTVIFKEMFGFAGWSTIGSIAWILKEQGGNILLNLFGGTAVNAARAISNQLNAAVTQFSTNFMTAINPQIIKSYSTSDIESLFSLVIKGIRFSYYLLLLLSLPIFMSTSYVLSIWLQVVPEHTILFVQLALCLGMVESISNPIATAQAATGRIKIYQIIVGGLLLLNLPVSYILLKMGAMPEIILIVAIIISLICFVVRINILSKTIGSLAFRIINKVCVNLMVVTIASIPIPMFLKYYMFRNYTFLSFVLISAVAFLCTVISIYYIGCSRKERHYIYDKISMFITKSFNIK